MPLGGQGRLLGVDVKVALAARRQHHLALFVGQPRQQLEQLLPLHRGHLPAAARAAPRARSSSQPTRSLKTMSRSGSWNSSWTSPSYCLCCLSFEVAASKNSLPAAGSAIPSAPPKSIRNGVTNSVARRSTVPSAAVDETHQ